MTRQENLRLYIEGLLSGKVKYKEIGFALIQYLNRIYEIYSTIVVGTQKEKKSGNYNRKKTLEVKDLVLTNIVDLNYPTNFNKIEAGLERIYYKFEEYLHNGLDIQESLLGVTKASEKAIPLATRFGIAGRKGGALLKKVKPIIGLITAIFTVFGTYKGISTWIKSNREKQSAILTRGNLSSFYNTVILPELRDVLEDIINNKIRDVKQLKKVFYNKVDIFVKANPEIGKYLSAWGAGI